MQDKQPDSTPGLRGSDSGSTIWSSLQVGDIKVGTQGVRMRARTNRNAKKWEDTTDCELKPLAVVFAGCTDVTT
jgi:hypothetical protein